jgi:hypothetical protein
LFVCEVKTLFEWLFPFYPSSALVFELSHLNEVGKEVVYESPFYPNTLFEWFPWDCFLTHKSLLESMNMDEAMKKRKRYEETSDLSKRPRNE